MNAKELAARLNGREYGNEITDEEAAQAKAAGLVVAFGYSDDNLELRGAAYDEISAYEGQTVFFTKAGLLGNDCDNDECPHFERAKVAATPLKICWNEGDGPAWTFEVFEDGEIFCRGVVFALADVPA